MSSPTQDEPDLIARFAAFQNRATAAQTRLEALQASIASVASVPSAHAVTARLDSRGRLESLEIDPRARKELPADGIGYDINLAIAEALHAQVAVPSPAPAVDLQALLEQVWGSATPDPRVATTWNEAHTVGIRTAAGVVQAVELSPAWLAQVSDPALVAEILRTARLVPDQEAH